MSSKTLTLRCERIQPGVPNKNGNIYTREVLQGMVESVRSKVEGRRLIGRVGGGTSTESVRISDASHIVTRLELDDDGHLVADLEVVSTQSGNELQRMVDAMGLQRLEIVPFGVGSVVMRDGLYREVQRGYALRAIDVVTKLRPYEDPSSISTEKTVRIRLPIVVDEHGNCYSSGWLDSHDAGIGGYEDMQADSYGAHCGAFVGSKTRVTRWVTIDVPIPVSESEIQGVVEIEGGVGEDHS